MEIEGTVTNHFVKMLMTLFHFKANKDQFKEEREMLKGPGRGKKQDSHHQGFREHGTKRGDSEDPMETKPRKCFRQRGHDKQGAHQGQIVTNVTKSERREGREA